MAVKIYHGDILFTPSADRLEIHENSYIIVEDGVVSQICEKRIKKNRSKNMNSSKYYDELYDYALNIVSKYEELLDCNLHVLPKGFFITLKLKKNYLKSNLIN